MHLIPNERTKLTASLFNTLATALVAAGAFAPCAAFLYGLSPSAIGGSSLIVLVFGCIALGVCLHLAGWALLGRLRE